jgi:hypothetical protein
MNQELKNWALRLYDAGFNVIPVNKNKKPLSKTWSAKERRPRKELEKPKNEWTGNAICGGPANPFGDVGHIIFIDVDQISILEKCPTLNNLISKTVNWKTGPRCPSCGEKNELESIKEGERFKCKKCKTEFTVEKAKFGRTAMFSAEPHALKKYFGNTTKRYGPIEILINNYALIPPSIHPTGVRYEWIKPIDFTQPNFGIHPLTEEEIESILKELKELGLLQEKTQETQQTKAQELTEQKTLSKERIHDIVELLRPYYVRGYRDKITFYFAGLCKKHGINEESVKSVIELLAKSTQDEELNQRIYVVEYHYQNRQIPLEKYKGISGLKQVLEEQLLDLSDSERSQKVSEVINKLYSILGIEYHHPGTTWLKRTSNDIIEWVSIGKSGIYHFRKTEDNVIITHVTSFIPKEVKRIRIKDTNITAYSVKLENEEINGEISEIIEHIEKRYGLDTRYKHAVEALIQKMAEEEEEAFYSPGTWVVNDKIMIVKKAGYTPAWKPDNEWSIMQTDINEPLAVLKSFVMSYMRPEVISAILSYVALTPIAYYIKRMLSIFPHMIIHGEEQSGKSALMDMIKLIFNIQENEPLPTTDYQMRKILTASTLPAIIDEIGQIIKNYQEERKSAYDVIEVLHRSATQEKLKSAGGGQYAGEYLAIRSVIMCTNTDVSFVTWQLDKFIILEISRDEKIDPEKARGVTAKTMPYYIKEAMQGIGYAIIKKLESKLPEIEALRGESRENLSQKLIQIGYEIWKELYKENDLEPFPEPKISTTDSKIEIISEYEDTFTAYIRKCIEIGLTEKYDRDFPKLKIFRQLTDPLAEEMLESEGAIIYTPFKKVDDLEIPEKKQLICKTMFLTKYQTWAMREYKQNYLGWKRLSEKLNMTRTRLKVGSKTFENLLVKDLDITLIGA